MYVVKDVKRYALMKGTVIIGEYDDLTLALDEIEDNTDFRIIDRLTDTTFKVRNSISQGV